MTKVRSGTGKLVWESYKQVGAVPGFLFVLSWLLWLSPEAKVSFAVVVPALFFLVFLLVVLLNAVWIAKSESRFISPRVLKGKRPAGDAEAAAMCLLEKSDFLRPGSVVTLYMRDGEDETPVADGLVVHVQENGVLHVNLFPIRDGSEDLFGRIAGNQADILQKLLVVPGGSLVRQSRTGEA